MEEAQGEVVNILRHTRANAPQAVQKLIGVTGRCRLSRLALGSLPHTLLCNGMHLHKAFQLATIILRPSSLQHGIEVNVRRQLVAQTDDSIP